MAVAVVHGVRSPQTPALDAPGLPAPFARWARAGTDRGRTIREIARHAHGAIDVFKLWPDKAHLTIPASGAVCAYTDRIGARLMLGAPSGPAAALHASLKELGEHAPWRTLAFAAINPEDVPIFRQQRYAVLHVGAEAVVDLEHFAQHTNRRYPIARYARRFARLGMTAERSEPPHHAALLDELERIAAAWRTLPGRRELGFAAGAYRRDYLAAVPVHALRDATGGLLAFVSELPTVGGIAGIDLMRRSPNAPGGSIDFLIQRVLSHARAAGAHSCSLGLAPLAGTGVEARATGIERRLAQLGRRAERAFGFRGLQRFKAKFEPRWEPRYLAVRGGPARIWHAMAALTLAVNTPSTGR